MSELRTGNSPRHYLQDGRQDDEELMREEHMWREGVGDEQEMMRREDDR